MLFDIGGLMAAGSGLIFNPTDETGHKTGNTVLEASASDYETSPSSATADGSIWVETDASNAYIRVDGNASGNVTATVLWYNASHVSQGTPGVDQDVFILGQRPDSINIYTSASDVADNGISLAAIGTYTNDDKTTFFSPTNAVNYGLKMDATSSAAPGVDFDNGSFTIQITFRKTGYTDLTVAYDVTVDTDAEGDF